MMLLIRVQSFVLAAMLLVSMSAIARAVFANDVEIVHASFRHAGDGWSVDVTLRHADTGWEHYADAWRVVADDGGVLGTRTLYHPHENEQPFTRSLGVKIPAGMTTVYVEAHDKVHGWSPQRVRVDLDSSKGERFEVSR
jgi:hypothetical protein